MALEMCAVPCCTSGGGAPTLAPLSTWTVEYKDAPSLIQTPVLLFQRLPSPSCITSMSTTDQPRPLAGVRVLEVSHHGDPPTSILS